MTARKRSSARPLTLDPRRLKDEAPLLRVTPPPGVSPRWLAEEIPRRILEAGVFFMEPGVSAWIEGTDVIVSVQWNLTVGRRRTTAAEIITDVAQGGRIERLTVLDREFPKDWVRLVLVIDLPVVESTQPALVPDDASVLVRWLRSWLDAEPIDVWVGASRVATSNLDDAIRELVRLREWTIVDADTEYGVATRMGVSIVPFHSVTIFARGPATWSEGWQQVADTFVEAAMAFPMEVQRARLVPVATEIPPLEWSDARRAAPWLGGVDPNVAPWVLDETGPRWIDDLAAWWGPSSSA